MKTTLAIVTAISGFTTLAQAGPNRPGFIFQQATNTKKVVRIAQPAGPQCTMKRTEAVDSGRRPGGAGYVVSKAVNCTGQKCCGTTATMTKAGCSAMR